VHEGKSFVPGPQGVALGKTGHDRAPVAQQAGYRRRLSRRRNDAHLRGGIGAVALPRLLSVKDSAPSMAATREETDFGRAFPSASVGLDSLVRLGHVPLRVAEYHHAIAREVVGLIASNERNFDSRALVLDIRYVSRLVFELISHAIADQDRSTPRIDHITTSAAM
jgi:hypothetical protein